MSVGRSSAAGKEPRSTYPTRRFASIALLTRSTIRCPGGLAVGTLGDWQVPAGQVLRSPGEDSKHVLIRLLPARLSNRHRWESAATRAHEIAVAFACCREAFGKKSIHERAGFQIAEQLIALCQAELVRNWGAVVIDLGSLAARESLLAKIAVSEALYRAADRCMHVMGRVGVTQSFREIAPFRIYDERADVHNQSLANKINPDFLNGAA